MQLPQYVSRIASAAASTNATSAKTKPGVVFNIVANNTNAALRYLKLYNKASAPTVGTDTPMLTIPLRPQENTIVSFSSPIIFTVGIAYALTTGAADNDTGALTSGDVVGLNVVYS